MFEFKRLNVFFLAEDPPLDDTWLGEVKEPNLFMFFSIYFIYALFCLLPATNSPKIKRARNHIENGY